MVGQLVWWKDPDTGVEGLLWTDNGPEPGAVDGTREGLTDDLNCCCVTSGCDCSSICSAPHWRVQFQLPGASDCIGGLGTCFESASYTGTMTEYFNGDPEWAPDPQPPTVPIARYWRATASLTPCGIPDPVLIEFCCVGSDNKRYIRINSQSWCDVGGTDCDHYWNRVDITGAEIATNTANPACCGTVTLEIWCGATPDPPNCDLVQTGSGTCA